MELKLKRFSPTNKMGVIKQDNFDVNKLKIKEVKGDKFKKMTFVYEGIPPVIEIEGWFSLYKNWFDGRKSYSVGIQVDKRFVFKGLEKKMIELASEEFRKESLKLIKKNKKGDEVIYCKAATDLNGKPQKVGCKIAGRKTSYGEFEDVCKVGSFYGKCEICLLYAFKGRTCGFTLEAKKKKFAKLMSEITP